MEIGSVLGWASGVIVIVGGLGVLFLMGYPSRFMPASYRSEPERAAEAEIDRRHHHLVNRLMSIGFSVISGVFAVVILVGPVEKRSGGLVMAAMSIASATVFVLLMRRGRRRVDRRRQRPDRH
jgi:predicted MFS family arabinose efflux permease